MLTALRLQFIYLHLYIVPQSPICYCWLLCCKFILYAYFAAQVQHAVQTIDFAAIKAACVLFHVSNL